MAGTVHAAWPCIVQHRLTKIRHVSSSVHFGLKMKGFPMVALKPYAQCVSNHELSVQDMGRCRLLFNAQCVDDVHIVRYHDERDGSTHVQFLGMRRADDILFYCADLTKMSVSVSSNDSVIFQNKPMQMRPCMFKLTGCDANLLTWARNQGISDTISQSPQVSQAQAAVVVRRPFSPSNVPQLLASPGNAAVSDSDSSDDELPDRTHEDLEVLTTSPKDAAVFPWLIRVKIRCSGQIGYLCSICMNHEKGAWSTQPCFSDRIQRKKRHAASAPHLQHAAGLQGAAQLSKVRSIQHNKAMATLRQQFLIAEYIAMNLLPIEQFAQMITLNKELGTFGTESVAVYESNPVGKEMIQCLAHAVRHVHHQRWQKCDVIGVTIDETTDKSVTSQLIICYKYFHDGVVYEECAGVQALPNGKSETITAAVLHALQRDDVPLSKLVFFGTDGASTMVGQRKGVHKRLSQLAPELIGYHCALHRWSLACKHTWVVCTNIRIRVGQFRHCTSNCCRRTAVCISARIRSRQRTLFRRCVF